MLGILIKVTTPRLASINKSKSIKLERESIDKIKQARKTTPDAEVAIIGVIESGKVAFTGKLNTVAVNHASITLKFCKVFDARDRWSLPIGYGTTEGFIGGAGEALHSEEDVLACLIRSPQELVAAKPKMPIGFQWKPSASLQLLVTFDNEGKPELHSKRALIRKELGTFSNYEDALRDVWEGMDGHKFQDCIAEVFESLDFTVTQGGRGREGGVDLTLKRTDDVFGEETYLVQCKRYSPMCKVDAPTVNELRGVAQRHPGCRCVLVTSSTFTKAAREAAEVVGMPVTLIDSADLAKLVLPRIRKLPTIEKLLKSQTARSQAG